MISEFFSNTSAILVVLLLLKYNDLFTFGISVDEDLTLTFEEKNKLDMFKKEVKHLMPHDYMKSDIYLVKWLRVKDLDINRAKASLLDNLKWREHYKMDGILQEDWSYWEANYPFYSDGIDNENRPLGTADIRSWDIRKVVTSGREEEFMRYTYRNLELGYLILRQTQNKGFNVTQGSCIGNLDGFSLITHGCLRCVPLAIRFLLAFQEHYPGMTHKLILINAPASFEFILNIARPLFDIYTQKAFEIYGTNKKMWQDKLLSFIPKDQLRSQFGGTKSDTYYSENDF